MRAIDKDVEIAVRRSTAERMHASKRIAGTKPIESVCWQSPQIGYNASATSLFSFV